jgi:Trk K+ transport system NAD-binding subunit
VHHRRLVQGALRILEQKTVKELGGVSLPDLSKLLRHGHSIGIHDGKGQIFSFALRSSKNTLVGKTPEHAFPTENGARLVAVVRGRDVLAPNGAGHLQVGDSLILVGDRQAHAEFVRTHGDEAVLSPG